MESIEINHPELESLLYGFSDWFFARNDLGLLRLHGKPDEKQVYTSYNHLIERQNIDARKEPEKVGYPSITHGIDLMVAAREGQLPWSMTEPVTDINKDLNNWFGSKFCAVQMYYPPGGFMNWHHNANCPGYNILISYSDTGDGFFSYQDPISRAIVTMEDKPGWTAKVGYFGSFAEKNRMVWHCARTRSAHRLTFGYVIPDKEMWKMMCDDITDVQ